METGLKKHHSGFYARSLSANTAILNLSVPAPQNL